MSYASGWPGPGYGEDPVQRRLRRELERELRQAAEARTVRERKERERAAREAEHATRAALAERRTQLLALRVEELTSFLKRCAASEPLSFADLIKVQPQPFEPGVDGDAPRAPTPPVMPLGNLFDLRARRRWFAKETERYERALALFEEDERARRARLDVASAQHERREAERRSRARRRAARLSSGINDGDAEAIEEFVRLAIDALPLPQSITLSPSVVYRTDPREVVIDLRLPDDDIVPAEKSVKYVMSRKDMSVKERPQSERESIYRSVLAQLPLVVADVVFRAFTPESVGSVSVNGRLAFTDPATGRQRDDFFVSLTAGRDEVAQLALKADGLDPVMCIRELGARLSPHPLARESVPPFLTFDEAKYKLGSPVDVAGDLDGRANLATMPWQDFEQLVRQLLVAMQSGEVQVTRGSRDDGIDGVVFDCNAALGGEYIVQAKRYKKVVPAVDVRALAGTMHDKRANHALFVTTAWFSPDGRRFAEDNRVRLIEGPELRKLLLDHLGLDVLIPPYRGRARQQSSE